MLEKTPVSYVRLFTKVVPCAHSCRYCLIGKKSYGGVAFPRFQALAERFIAWDRGNPNSSHKLLIGFEDCYDFDVETLQGLFALQSQLKWPDEIAYGIKLGGLRMRSRQEMRDWLRERQTHAGLKTVHASLAGYGDVHDRWNGRKGDFQFLCQTMELAAELELRIHQRIFVTQSTMPGLTALLDHLESISDRALQYLSTFIFQGLAIRLEHERITERDRDALPTRVKALLPRSGEDWLSEREWMASRTSDITANLRPISVDIEVTHQNLDRYETMTCDAILAECASKARASAAGIPDLPDLCERFGDPSNERIYATLSDLERKWTAQFLKAPRFQAELTS
jgi:hypothetical protein